MKKVLIVKEGQWGDMKPEDYKEQIEMYGEILCEAERIGPHLHKEKMAQVWFADTAQEAEERLKQIRMDVVVFISRGMESAAKRLAFAFPSTRVMVFTGLIPEGEVVWVSKGWLTSRQKIQDIVLSD